MTNVELEAKVADMEKRIVFLYKSLETQTEINKKCIECIRDLIGTTNDLTAASMKHTRALEVIVTYFEKD